MVKTKCSLCEEDATWRYAPACDWPEHSKHFCDIHINRGCSCNIKDKVSGEEYKDDLGRLFPCCEYDYSLNGFIFDPGGSWVMQYEDWTPYIEDHEWNLFF